MKRMITFFFTLLFATSLFAQEKEVYIHKSNVSTDDKEIKVTCKVDDDKCAIIIVKDGEVKKITVPLDSLHILEDFTRQLDIDTDIDVHRWIEPFTRHERTWLGVSVQPLTEQLRDYFKVRGSGGVLVTEVVEGSPAEKTELKAGDIILSVDREKMEDTGDLVKVIREKDPGDEVRIRIAREGRKKSVTATLESRTVQKSKEMRFFSEKFDKDLPPLPMFEHFPPDLHKDLESLRKELKELRKELEELKKERQKVEKS